MPEPIDLGNALGYTKAPEALGADLGSTLGYQAPSNMQMIPAHAPFREPQMIPAHTPNAPHPRTPIDDDMDILIRIVGPEKAALAIQSSDYQPGMISKLTQPDTGAVQRLNNLTGGMLSGGRDVTLGQAQTVMALLNKIRIPGVGGVTPDSQVALNEGLMRARDEGLAASGTPSVGRFVGNAAASLSPVSLAGSAMKVRAIVQALRSGKALQLAGAGGLLGMGGAAVQPYATPGSVEAGGAAGAVLTPVIPGAVALAQKAGQRIGALGGTPAAAEMLDELGAKLGGKSPGEALQDAAHTKYNAAWDEFKKAIAPVDAEAGGVAVNYDGPIQKLNQVLGVGQKRPPMPMPKERQEVLEGLLKNLEEAKKPDGMVDNSFQGAIDTIKWLGSEQRRLSVKHGDTEARAMLGDVRDSIMKAMEDSSPELSQKAQEARKVFATQVAPLFDKSEGGNFLTQIRDTPTPGDLLGSANQGALTRMKPDKAAIIAKGSSADPLLYSYLDAAIKQGDGKPGPFINSLKKAMPAIEAIGDPATVEAFQGLVRVAETSRFSGTLANIGIGAAMPGHGALGPAATIGATFAGKYSGPALMWRLLQSPSTRKLLSFAAKLPGGSPELQLIARDLSGTLTKSLPAARTAANIQPFNPGQLPAAADNGSNPLQTAYQYDQQ